MNVGINFSLKPCPFCGNPAEIVKAEPFSFRPNKPTKAITCSSEWCVARQIKIRFDDDLEGSIAMAFGDWNKRRRKNKLTWKGGREE